MEEQQADSQEEPMGDETAQEAPLSWLDGWGEITIWLAVVIGGSTGFWADTLLKRQFDGVSGSIFGLGDLDRWEGLCGGILLGGLAGVALVLVIHVLLNTWKAVTD